MLLPRTSAQELRILLLKATHTPFLGIIWLYERWEAFELKRETAALSLNILGAANRTLGQGKQSSGRSKTNVAVSSTNRKHTLKKSGKVRVPSALLSTASKRPSKQGGAPQDTRVRINTAPAAYGRGGLAGEGTGAAQEMTAIKVGGADTTTLAQNVDVAEMMRMLKALTAQVEEVRAALVKHDQGPVE